MEFHHVAGGINWYCEQRGNGPAIVLIPSGEGDCGSFAKVADALSDEFTILSFDTPGFSRSGPPPLPGKQNTLVLAEQVSELVESLSIGPATFYGSGSGGIAVLSLVACYSSLVRNAIVHEAELVKDYAFPDMAAAFQALNLLDDNSIIAVCRDLFRTQLNLNPQPWDDLGWEYHLRLEKNFVPWVRHYLTQDGDAFPSYNGAELQRRPIAWSIGGYSPVWFGLSNLRVAHRAGIDVEIFKCRHFPQVEIPEILARHIRRHARQHLPGIAGSETQSSAKLVVSDYEFSLKIRTDD
jgi:pimeloyl-ACP methyl ester carboxylesterase